MDDSQMDEYLLIRSSINDLNKQIEINPDKAVNYRRRADFRNFTLGSHFPCNEFVLHKAIEDYRVCISKDPTVGLAWIGLISVYIMAGDYDEAVSLYGQCTNYMSNDNEKIARSMLGCIALTLAGDKIEKEDLKELSDTGLIISRVFIGITSTMSYLAYLQEKDKEQWNKVVPIAKMYIQHYESWKLKANSLNQIKSYYEAFDASVKALSENPDDTGSGELKKELLKKVTNDRKVRAIFVAASAKEPRGKTALEVRKHIKQVNRSIIIAILILLGIVAIFVGVGTLAVLQKQDSKIRTTPTETHFHLPDIDLLTPLPSFDMSDIIVSPPTFS